MSEPKEYNLTTGWMKQRIVELSETLARGGILHEAYASVIEARELVQQARQRVAGLERERDEARSLDRRLKEVREALIEIQWLSDVRSDEDPGNPTSPTSHLDKIHELAKRALGGEEER